MNRLPAPKISPALRGMAIEGLLAFAEALAAKHHDGHFVCFRHTTCWQVTFGNPKAFVENAILNQVPQHKSLKQALIMLISSELERRP